MLQWDALLKAVVGSVAFSLVGVVMFALTFFVVQKILPFSVRKEIEVDQNVALGIVIGSIIIGLAMIVSAAVHG